MDFELGRFGWLNNSNSSTLVNFNMDQASYILSTFLDIWVRLVQRFSGWFYAHGWVLPPPVLSTEWICIYKILSMHLISTNRATLFPTPFAWLSLLTLIRQGCYSPTSIHEALSPNRNLLQNVLLLPVMLEFPSNKHGGKVVRAWAKLNETLNFQAVVSFFLAIREQYKWTILSNLFLNCSFSMKQTYVIYIDGRFT